MTRLELDRISHRLGTTQVLREVSLAVEHGEFVTVVGPSGCGKSTLLRVAAGLIEPDAGALRLDGVEVNGWEPRRRDVAMVFQNYALYPHLSVERNLAFPLENARLSREAIRERVRASAELLGLGPLLARKPAELSGGQMQRVALGRAIVRDPRYFLFDEPLSNLDPRLRAELRVEIAALQRRLGIPTLYVTHDQAEALSLGSRVCVMWEGALEQVGSPREVWERPTSTRVATLLGSPAMNLLRLRIEAGRAVLGDLRLEVPPTARGNQIVLGIRPHELELGGELQLQVEWIEEQGDRQVLEGSVGQQRLRVVGALGNGLKPGSSIGIRLGSARRHWFEAGSGKRIHAP
ncbi:MAG: ABC transporter ATP-binding protein [Planctomycetes bacterium]|nr:ABC transporter ATP-binding protein [Planctomycetota bacterium]